MLLLLGCWLFLNLLCLPVGVMQLRLIVSRDQLRMGDRIILSFWLGIGLLGLALLVVSLLIPLRPQIGLLVAAILVAASLVAPQVRRELFSWTGCANKVDALIVVGVSVLVAAFMAQPVDYYDVGLYHLQAIKWLAQYGLVPGVAMIHDRLGFVSSWFALAAPFQIASFGARVGMLTGGLSFLWLTLHAALAVRRIVTRRAAVEDWFLTLAYALCSTYLIGNGPIVSPTPDVPVTSLTLLIAWSFLQTSNVAAAASSTASSRFRLLPLLLAGAAVAMKMSALPLLVIAFLFCLGQRPYSSKRALLVGAITLALLLPVLIANTVASGCWLYPSPWSCLDLPWSVGVEGAQYSLSLIRNYGRWGSYVPQGGAYDWIGPWSKAQPDSVAYILLSLLFAAWLAGSKKIRPAAGWQWVVALGLLGQMAVLATGPSVRFNLGAFVIVPALACALFRQRLLPLVAGLMLMTGPEWLARPAKFGMWLLCCLALAATCFVVRSKRVLDLAMVGLLTVVLFLPLKRIVTKAAANLTARENDIPRLLVPPAHRQPDPGRFALKQINDVVYWQFVGDSYAGQCWAVELPCTPKLLVEQIKLRDPQRGLAAGFVRANDR